MNVRRSLLPYALMLVVPAIVLAAFGLYSVAREDRTRRDDARRHAVVELRRMVDEEWAELEAVRAREARRPYYQYRAKYMPEDALAAGPAFVDSPLVAAPEDARVLGWFQWTFAQGVVAGPDLFPSQDVAWGRTLADGFASRLRQILERAPADPGVATAPSVKVPVQTLMANEEAGQLLEEVQVAAGSNRATNYLENFQKRQTEGAPTAATDASRTDAVDVRVTPFAYLLRDPARDGAIDVVAWRVVWIPGTAAAARRSAPRDRWMLQGYVLDAGRSFPAAFTSVGDGIFAARGTGRGPLPSPASALAFGALVDRFGAPTPDDLAAADPSPVPPRGDEVAAQVWRARAAVAARAHDLGGRRAMIAWPRLHVFAAPAEAALDDERRASLLRYGVLAAGLLLVSVVGLFVVGRTVRREMAAAERKQDFVAAVTHELKTPLASIRMYADMLKEGWVPEGEGVGDYAERIVDETKRLATLVDQVLDFAALERGTATVAAIPADLGPVVREAVAMVAPAAQAAGVPVALDVEAGLPAVRCDAGLVRSLVVNLVDNAVKYSAGAPTKDVRVTVRAGAGTVDVVVADRGPGIPAAEQARLFEPFSRGGREDTRTARGVGLGLALVRRYADAHRARIALESTPGHGTTVTVRFPRA